MKEYSITEERKHNKNTSLAWLLVPRAMLLVLVTKLMLRQRTMTEGCNSGAVLLETISRSTNAEATMAMCESSSSNNNVKAKNIDHHINADADNNDRRTYNVWSHTLTDGGRKRGMKRNGPWGKETGEHFAKST